MKNKALFIDRDGVINKMVLQENGSFDSPQTKEQVSLVDGIVELISYCNNNNITVIEVSNQPGVAKNKMTLETLEEIENTVHFLLKEHNVVIDKVYRCLHHPRALNETYKIECACRKPKPGLLLQAAKDTGITLQQCVFLGDNVTDIEAGIAAGCTPILFLHEDDERNKVKANKLCETKYCVKSHKESLALMQQLL